MMVLPGRLELPFAASEAAALSIELRELKYEINMNLLEVDINLAIG
jgi:hypothetical protein